VSSAIGATEAPRAPGPAGWRTAELRERRRETASAATLLLDPGDWPGHRAGQHVDVRLTADDGYQAQRSYSIASAPEEGMVALTVVRFADGEVSPYLVDEMRPGDVLELRGPIGGWFVWDAHDGGPLLLVAGGSGLVPLMAMLRHRHAVASHVPARLLVSARGADDVLYSAELAELAGADDGFELLATLTRDAPTGWSGFTRRVDREMLEEVAWSPTELARTYICGPTAFVEAAAEGLVGLGHDPALVKTERFGPTGGSET
jgi:ferredoxin-NADP reductase